MMRNISKWILTNPIKAIVIVALLVRLLVVILYQHVTVYPDSEDYIYLAHRLLAFDLIGYEGQRSPGYPLLLALLGNSPVLVATAQLLLGVFTLVLAYKTFLLLGIKDKVALVVTLLSACYIPIIFFELAVLSETLTLFCITLVFYSLFSFLQGNRKNLAVLIIASVFLVLIKPFYIFLPIIIALFLLFRDKRNLRRALLIVLLPLLVFFGWSYINKVNTGYFTPTTFAGFNLAQNCVSFAENTSAEYAEIGRTHAQYRGMNHLQGKDVSMSIWDAYPALKEETGLSFPDLSNRLYEYGKASIELNKISYVKQVFISWRDFWKTSMYVEYDKAPFASAASIIKYISLVERIVFQLVKAVFLLLIPFQVMRCYIKRELSTTLLLMVIVLTASVLQSLVTYGTNSRFSYPFGFLILASVLMSFYEYKGILKEKS